MGAGDRDSGGSIIPGAGIAVVSKGGSDSGCFGCAYINGELLVLHALQVALDVIWSRPRHWIAILARRGQKSGMVRLGLVRWAVDYVVLLAVPRLS
jgi:hypothetical protein